MSLTEPSLLSRGTLCSGTGRENTKGRATRLLEHVWKGFFDLSTEDIELRRDAFQRVARRIMNETQQSNVMR